MSQILAKWLTNTVEFPVGGGKWPLIFTYRALFLAKDITGVDMLSANLSNLSASLMRGMIFAAITCTGAACSLDDVGKSIRRLGSDKTKMLLVSGWMASMCEPDIKAPGEPEALAKTNSTPITWIDIWAAARDRDIGLSDDEWLDMTPRQFHALQTLQLARMRREELLNGILAATFENFSMCAPKSPVKPEAFMMHPFPPLPIGEQIMAEMSKLKH